MSDATTTRSRRRWLLLAGACAAVPLLVVSVLLTPAHLLARAAPPEIRALTWDWRGNLLRGSTALAAPQNWLAPGSGGHLAWALAGIRLPATLQANTTLTGPHHHLSGQLSASITGARLERAAGHLDLALLADLLARYELAIGGSIRLADVAVDMVQGRPRLRRGRAHWSGGPVAFRLADEWYNRDLPALDGTVTATNQLEVTTVGGDMLLVLALSPEGWLRVEARRRLLDLAGVQWPGSEPPDAAVVVVEERLF